MEKVFSRINKVEVPKEHIGLDLSAFTPGSGHELVIDNKFIPEEPKKRGPGRPRKSKYTEEILGSSDRDLKSTESNEPYLHQYKETNNMLKNSIGEIDVLNRDISMEISKIKDSRVLKRKYEYITDLTNTSSNLINAKISAIRELNKTITDCNNLEIKRIKDLKLNTEVDDDKHIMDMYNAFINTPVTTGSNGLAILGPTGIDTTVGTGLLRANDTEVSDAGYSNYLNSLTPEENRMRLEGNPNIKTVVVYNKDTGERYFDVVDSTTGNSIPNYARPDSFLLEDTYINLNAGMAVNNNIGKKWELVVVGGNTPLSKF